MGRLARDTYKRKLARLLGGADDESMFAYIAAIDAVQSGKVGAKERLLGCPDEAVGAELGSAFHIPLWVLETLVNELLCTPKSHPTRKQLRHDHYANYRMLYSLIAKIENAEDGIFLDKHDIFTEMHRIGQRQFPWQRGWLNAPSLYRALILYGSGEPAAHFEREFGISVPDFMLVGAWLGGALSNRNIADRFMDLSTLGVDAKLREAAIARLAIGHIEARRHAYQMRFGNRQIAYKPSILRDFPIISFGERSERLRAPLPSLISYRITFGLYLDTVSGGAKVWKHFGNAFEGYCADYLTAMLSPLKVQREFQYGPKKTSFRTPDLLISEGDRVRLVAECKAKRMPFEARFADDPVAEARAAYNEIAKGIFQVWRFFSHVRRGLISSLNVESHCLGMLITVDPWLMMARNQERAAYEIAHELADECGDIEEQDRRHIAICQIDDVETALQNGTPWSFMNACRELTSGEKRGWLLSLAHVAEHAEPREYPFLNRFGELLPWWAELTERGEMR
jgi:hypothetical protein